MTEIEKIRLHTGVQVIALTISSLIGFNIDGKVGSFLAFVAYLYIAAILHLTASQLKNPI